MKDLELLAARFLTGELPKPKEYLRKYCKGQTQERLVIYYLTFGYDGQFKRFYQNFIDHTGMYCSERVVYRVISRVTKVEARLARAEKEKDHESVALIKTGKFWPTHKRCPVKP